MKHAQSLTPERLQAFFHPRSIALVGATDSSPWSDTTFQNLKIFGFAGPIYCVNPNYEIIHGEPAFKRLSELPQSVDLAFVMVATNLVYTILQEAAEMDIRNVVILASGFSEMGERGQELEQKLLDFAQEHDMIVLGPNGNGFVNVVSQIIPFGLSIQPPLMKGPVGVVLQSGALASAVIPLAQAHHIGLSFLVSMGNEAMISATDVIDYLIEDEETRVIAVFLETIRHPALFERVARKALAHNKPIVALKVGKSAITAMAAMAHTGALVGNDALNDAVFKQLGIIRVDSLEDLLITSEVLGYSPPLTGRRMGLVASSGGICDIIADNAHKENIQFPDFAPETVRDLQQLLPQFSTVHNPLDVTGYIVIERTLQRQALQVVMKDPGLDFIVYLFDPPRVEPPPLQLAPTMEHFNALGKLIHQSRLPIIVLTKTSIDLPPFGRTISDEAGIHFVGGMEHGMRAVGNALWWYETAQQSTTHPQVKPPAIPPIDLPTLPKGNWSEYTTRAFLQTQGIAVAPGMLATNAEDAVRAAQTYGLPVAMKISASDILHKSDVGGVMLNVASKAEVRQGFHSIMHRVHEYTQSSTIDGILISPMRPAGIELLVGIINDASWGQTLVIGLGGIWTELFNDTSMRMMPVQREDIKIMLSELRGASLLHGGHGGRGQAAVDIEHVADCIFRISQVAMGLEGRLEALEINPLLLHGSNIEVLDALITWL